MSTLFCCILRPPSARVSTGLTKEVAEDPEMTRSPTMTGQIKTSLNFFRHSELKHAAHGAPAMVVVVVVVGETRLQLMPKNPALHEVQALFRVHGLAQLLLHVSIHCESSVNLQ
jgi:hypothetical protein